MLQVSRPCSLKKEAIQTRNRKLSSKSKKKKTGMSDLFRTGLDGRYAGFSSGMGMGGMSHTLSSPMPGYYPQMSSMSGQFMSPSSMYMGGSNPPLNLSQHSIGSGHAAFS